MTAHSSLQGWDPCLIAGEVRAVTRRAYQTQFHGFNVWIPKSCILAQERDDPQPGDTFEMVIPAWLHRAKEDEVCREIGVPTGIDALFEDEPDPAQD